MTGWDSLLAWLAGGPRENGTAALEETAARLLTTAQQLGLEAVSVPYMGQPYRLRLAGVVIALGTFLYAWLLWRRRGGAAFLVALAVPIVILLELDRYVPLFGWIGATTQNHVEATIPVADAQRHLILAAHFDSKTDVLDHVERVPVELLGVPMALVMMIAAVGVARGWRGRRRWTIAAIAAAIYGCMSFVSLSAGALLSERSHGALDDGASCAVLLRLGERLLPAPPQRTRVTLLFLSGEEVGVYGSWVYARERFATPPEIPTSVINLEFLGAAPDLGVFRQESFTTARYPPDPELLAIADQVHRELRGKPIYVSWYGAGTDARSFLAHGIPALTLFSDPPGHPLARDLHSAADTRARVDIQALDVQLELLERMVRVFDAGSDGD